MTDLSQVQARYSGQKGPLFRLALRIGVLTFITLGIYRFWGKTRIRRYVWSSAEIDGDRFEYTGTGLEKFLGFLLAVVFLAVYLGLVQIVLAFAGLSVLTEAQTETQMVAQALAVNLTFLAVIPFILFAIYRARRYKLARTRWRGIRFGMEKGAWGYVARALFYYPLTFVSLGLLLPLQSFKLEEYMTNRMWFGDTRFTQGGKWTGLYRAMTHIFVGLGLMMLAGAAAAAMRTQILGGLLGFAGSVWLIFGLLHYRVQSFAYLTRHKRLGDDITFDAQPRTEIVLLTYVTGGAVIALVAAVFGGLLAAIAFFGMGDLLQGNTAAPPPVLPGLILALGYFALLIGIGAGVTALITQPIIAHYVSTFSVLNIAAVDEIHQRAADSGADAEGFADALDIGGAI